MSAAAGLRDDFTAADLRRLAGKVKDADEARRLLALAAVYDGMDRGTAARIGGMDRQPLRDWIHRFNEHGPLASSMSNQRAVDRSFRWSHKRRCGNWWRPAPIQRRMALSVGDAWTCSVWLAPSSVSICRQSLLVAKRLGFSHISARPQHPAQDPEAIAAFKKTSPLWSQRLCEFTTPIEVWFLDEMCVGQKNGLVYQWAKKGTRPRQPKDQRYENAYLFGAVCPGSQHWYCSACRY